jgi:hypothetical protein
MKEISTCEPAFHKDAPEKIYLQVCDDSDCEEPFCEHHDVTWCQDKIEDTDVPYVRADLVAQAQREQGPVAIKHPLIQQIANLIDENQRLRAELNFGSATREWVGLTDEVRKQRESMAQPNRGSVGFQEAKLKEKSNE